jgi:hypothetical protein
VIEPELTVEIVLRAVPRDGCMPIDEVAQRRRRLQRSRLPEWRRPCGALASNTAETERTGLREALFDLAGRVALTEAELRDGVLEHWGDATAEDVHARLRELVHAGALARSADGYTRWEP